MSKVPYTVNVDEYVCTALELIRTMDKTRDYSALMATVERIQFHASRMEEAISASFNRKWQIKNLIEESSEITAEEFKEKVIKIMSKEED